MKGRSSYQLSVKVLRAVGDGLTPGEIKSREGLSRYSYRYVLNRLINAGLVEDRGDSLVLLNKGLNVLSFEGEKNVPEIENISQISVKQ